jgi:hypothetical protein
MPYIKAAQKHALAAGARIDGPGELNYSITELIKRYWVNSPRNYASLNDVMGALESAKAEFYRRVAVPFEENKIRENGDVW